VCKSDGACRICVSGRSSCAARGAGPLAPPRAPRGRAALTPLCCCSAGPAHRHALQRRRRHHPQAVHRHGVLVPADQQPQRDVQVRLRPPCWLVERQSTHGTTRRCRHAGGPGGAPAPRRKARPVADRPTGGARRGPAQIRTRRAEFYEPTALESCCAPGGASRVKYSTVQDAVRPDREGGGPSCTRASGRRPRGSGGAPPTHTAYIARSRRQSAPAAPAPPPQEWDEPVAAELTCNAAGKTEAKWMCTMETTSRGYRGEVELEVEVQVIRLAGSMARAAVVALAWVWLSPSLHLPQLGQCQTRWALRSMARWRVTTRLPPACPVPLAPNRTTAASTWCCRPRCTPRKTTAAGTAWSCSRWSSSPASTA
jgi:hypothetical protein